MKRLKIQPVGNDLKNDLKSDEEKSQPFLYQELPDLSLVNIHNLESLKLKLDSIKMSNNQSMFLKSIQDILDIYDSSELQNSEKLVLFVMSEVEKFLLKPKCGADKENIVVAACKPYFKNDEEIVRLIIKLLIPNMRQVKFCKRQILKVSRFFVKVLWKAK
jgi:hypothetical protein